MIKKFLALLFLSLLTACGGTADRAGTQANGGDVKKLSVDFVWAMIHGQYGKEWPLLHPRDQRAVPRTFLESCKREQRTRAAGVEVLSIEATVTPSFSTPMPLLGTISVRPVTLVFRTRKGNFKGTLTRTVYWTRVEGQWRGILSPLLYSTYVKHRCPSSLVTF